MGASRAEAVRTVESNEFLSQKNDASSPTISTEAVFFIIIISAKEERDVASVDIPGAFLQTELNDNKVHIRIEGRVAELLAMIGPKLY